MRITRLKIQGFRSYGREEVEIDLGSPVTILEGDNSHGKTATAEAIEFLLTGDISRRFLAGSEKAEFEGCLRNVHAPQSIPVYVEAVFQNDDVLHRARRTLTTDARARSAPESTLTVDDQYADDLSSLGIHLSSPPTQAPILLQHNLRYLLHAAPQKRADYFKAILDISDAETIRTAIKELSSPGLNENEAKHLAALQVVVGSPNSESAIVALRNRTEECTNLCAAATAAVKAYGTGIGVDISGNPPKDKLRSLIEDDLTRRRSSVFPAFALEAPDRTTPTQGVSLASLGTYNHAVGGADQSLTAVTNFLKELLDLPEVAAATEAIDCPACLTSLALSHERIAQVRKQVEEASGLHTAQAALQEDLESLDHLVEEMDQLAQCLPACAMWDDAVQQAHVDMAESLANSGDALRTALSSAMTLKSRSDQLASAVRGARMTTARAKSDLDSRTLVASAIASVPEDLAGSAEEFNSSLDAFVESSQRVRESIIGAVAQDTEVEGLTAALFVLDNMENLSDLVIRVDACTRREHKLRTAQADIDTAVQDLLDQRFEQMSSKIVEWWSNLRPGDASVFEKVERRGGGRRHLSLKARLNSESEGSDTGTIRDAIAVFSDSQLAALGLATFLARCVEEGASFVVLDDPLAGFDRDHRSTFANQTIQGLLDSGIQVIVSTCDTTLAARIQTAHEHVGVSHYRVTLANGATGTQVGLYQDPFEGHWESADRLSRSGDAGNRRSAARDARSAAERLAKQIIVGHRRKAGEEAHFSDHDGKVLSALINILAPYVQGPDELGKWRALAPDLNPGNHDAIAPAQNELRQALGYIRMIKRDHQRFLGQDWPTA